MTFVFGIARYFVGEFVISGILYAVFGKGDVNSASNKAYGWIGKILGVLLGILIAKSI